MPEHKDQDNHARRDVASDPFARQWLDEIADRFEAGWREVRQGASPPRLEDFVAEPDDLRGEALLCELIGLDIDYRRLRGETPRQEDYLKRFPQFAEQIRQCVAATKPSAASGLKIRCPHCHNPIEVLNDVPSGDVSCPSCGSSFNLAKDVQTGRNFDAGRMLGHFRLLDHLGQGAFGEVWKAHDTELDRIVALKFPRREHLSEGEAESFLREARAAAQVRHPNIVSVYEVGRERGQIYIASDFIDGATLDQWIQAHPLTVRESVELCATIAEALHHAHEAGVVHRDLKPQNILVDTSGEPHVADFGLAKRDAGEITMTVKGAILGTPAYMPPEQARGEAHHADRRSDVYSLGVILFRLLTGELPFRGQRQMLIVQILNEEPPALRKLDARLPRDVETICLKCLEKDPARRYQSAAALAADLRRWLTGHPIEARPVSRTERAWRWCHRNPAVASLVSVIALLLVAIAISSLLVAGRERFLRTEADNARAKAIDNATKEAEARASEAVQKRLAKDEAKRARHHLYDTHMNLAQAAWQDSRIGTVLDLLERHRNPTSREEDLRGFEWYYLDRLCHSELVTLKGHTKAVLSVSLSPDGRRLASGSLDGTVKVWDAMTGQQSPTFHGKRDMGYVSSVAFSPDGRRLAATTAYDAVIVWDAESGRELLQLKGHTGWVRGVAFSPDGKRLASAGCDSVVKIWDAVSGHELVVLKGHTDWVRSVVFSRDGQLLASCGNDSTVRVWDAQSGLELHMLKGHWHGVASVIFRPDGQRLASAGDDGTVRVWDTTNEKEVLRLVGHTPAASSVTFSADGQRLASGDSDSTVRVWDATSGQERFTLKGHTGAICSVVFSPDDRRLASGSEDGSVKIWDASGQESRSLDGHSRDVHGVEFSPDGKWLASASSDETVKIWDATSGRCVRTLSGHSGRVNKVAFSPVGSRLASAGQDQTVKVWDATNGKELLTLNGHSGPVYSVAFSPDGLRLASASKNQAVKMWDAMTGVEILSLDEHNGPVYSVAFSPDGLRLASASGGVAFSDDWSVLGSTGTDAIVKIWDIATGKTVLSLKGHTGWLMSVAFSADGQRLASAGEDTTVRVWDTTTGKQLHTLSGHRYAVFSVAFSPDGRRLVSAGADSSVKIWDTPSGEEVLTLKGQFGHVWCVSFSRDGQRLAAACGKMMVTVWDSLRWTPELKAKQQAISLVGFLSRKGLSQIDMVREIAADPMIDDRVRYHAIQLVGE